MSGDNGRRESEILSKTILTLMLVAVLAGCARPAPQTGVYPGKEWTWAPSPESLGRSPAKLALAQAYAKHIGSAAVMIVDDGVVVAA
jgi:hypothetical protein